MISGFACRAFSETTLVCFIVNEHTTKCSRYRSDVDISIDTAYFAIYSKISLHHGEQTASLI